MKKIVLSIDGMTCSACSNGLEKYLNKQEGVKQATVNLVMANATIVYDEKILDLEKLELFVKKAGFQSLGEFKEIKEETKSRKDTYTLIGATILALLLMYISMGHMLYLPAIPGLHPHKHTENYMISLAVLTIPFLVYGWDILKNGFKNLIHLVPNMDTLVGIGVVTSFFYSLYNMYDVINGNHSQVENLYFESSAIVIYFVKLGRYMDKLGKDKTKAAIQKLVKITPNKARIKVDGVEKEVTLDEIHKGELVICKAGEKIAVDGTMVNGKAHVDESFITGESKPVTKEAGSRVIAGNLNLDGYMEYEAEKIGKESTVSEIVKLVVEASNTKAPIAKVADKIAGYFVPVIMLIAIVTGLFYLFSGQGTETALTTFVTILVVACPCSLGLATPLAMIVSEGLCATNGILIKKSEILENAQKTNIIVFDKTGTLTYGTLKIAKVLVLEHFSEEKLLQIVGSIESKSTHPIAKAFVDYLTEHKVKPLEVFQFENVSGYGVTAVIDEETYIIGNAKILEKYGVKNTHQEEERTLSAMGNSIVYVVKDGEIIALIGVNDILRAETKEVIETLRAMKIAPIMLTGDNKETAEKIAGEIGITRVISDVLPKEKADTIRELKKDNHFVMMCGDGINDSPALAIADIGVSVNSGTDIAMDSSDVILNKNDLRSILDLIHISKTTIKNVKQNLFWAFFYNIVMIPIAMGVLKPFGISINPMIASLAMVLSSLTVTGRVVLQMNAREGRIKRARF